MLRVATKEVSDPRKHRTREVAVIALQPDAEECARRVAVELRSVHVGTVGEEDDLAGERTLLDLAADVVE